MKDIAHINTDKKLSKLEQELNTVYTNAYKEIKKELEKTFAKMELLENMTPQERLAIANKYNRLVDLEKKIALILGDVNLTSIHDINKALLDVYGLNYNYGGYLVESASGVNTSFAIIDKKQIENILKENSNPFTQVSFDEMKDKNAIVRDLKREFATSLIKGESIPKIAKRIQNVTEKNLNQSILIARTETTRVENTARLDSFKRAENMGINLEKQWLATVDNRTRESHIELDDKTVPLDDEFGLGMKYPGDPNGGASEVCNCRCSMITVFKDFDKSAKELELDERLKKMKYEEWRKSHE